jgi:hypothetical protein
MRITAKLTKSAKEEKFQIPFAFFATLGGFLIMPRMRITANGANNAKEENLVKFGPKFQNPPLAIFAIFAVKF